MTDKYRQIFGPLRILRIACEVVLLIGVVLYTSVPKAAAIGVVLIVTSGEMYLVGRRYKSLEEWMLKESDKTAQ